MRMFMIPTSTSVAFDWFLRLRWAAIAGQISLLLISHFALALDLPYVVLVAIVAVVACTNIGLHFVSNEQTQRRFTGIVLFLDTLALTALLGLSGGPSNPFSILYLVHVVLSAVFLNTAWTWVMAIVSSICFGFLFQYYLPIPTGDMGGGHHQHHDMEAHLKGMWLAFLLASTLCALFLTRIIQAIEQKERKLKELGILAAHQERLVHLTTLAAGAAHELGTPLATVSLVAHELERELKNGRVNSEAFLKDVSLVKQEVARCKEIITRMAGTAGEVIGEMPSEVSVKELFSFSLGEGVVLESSNTEHRIIVPPNAIRQAVQELVKNALDSSKEGEPVRVLVEDRGTSMGVTVIDTGHGMSEEVVNQLGNPFFTTKEFGKGLGLGVFLAKLTAERLGGGLTFQSVIGKGTKATLLIPKVGIVS